MNYERLFVFLLAACLSLPVFAQSSSDRIRAGNRALDSNQLDEAVGIFSQLAADEPQLAPAHQGLGIALLRHGELERARASLIRAFEIDPQLAKARFLLGLAYFGLGDAVKAKDEFEAELALRPRDKQTLLFLARTLLLMGKPAESVKILQRARDVDGSDPDTLWMLAENDPAHAEEYSRKLVEVAPHSQQAFHWLAEMHRRRGELPEAVAQYKQAIATAPDVAGLHLGLARVLSEMADYDAAIAAAQSELKVHAYSGAAHLLLSSLLLLNGSFEEAAGHASAAIGLSYRIADARLLLGRARFGMNDLPGAATELETAIRLNPNLREAYYKLVGVYSRLGREQDARFCLEKFRGLEGAGN